MKNKPFVFRTDKQVRYELLLKKPPKCYKAEGLCYDPSEKIPKILINPDQTDNRVLNTIIHEIAHAFFWEASEKTVNKFGNTVARLLAKEGWAKGPQKKPAKKKKRKQ
jgi:Zn-dependent peptidase ImmA (M78 family)